MAHKKGVGSTDNGRDSKSKRLGVKLFGGQFAKAGNIIIRQRGTKYHAGENAYMGKDFTIHASVDGTVAFKKRKKNRTFVEIIPDGVVLEAPAPTKPKVEKPVKAEAPAPVAEEKPAVEEAKAEAPEVKEEKPKAEATPSDEKPSKVKVGGKNFKYDDLKLVEGIGPKIAEIFTEAGIGTWEALGNAPVEKLKEILEGAGSRYKMHDPTSWPQQAKLAAEGKFEELEELQDNLKGGRIEEDDK